MSNSDVEITDLLTEIASEIVGVLADQLVGLYHYGSYVAGGFDPSLSDLDLLAATEVDIDESSIGALRTMHDAIAARHPAWDDRIEVAYLSRRGLRTFRNQRTSMAITSPGEPLHFRSAGSDWLMNWYLVREVGRTLRGPEPDELIAPVSKREFLASLFEHARWREKTIAEVRGRSAQSYTVLTMCRTLRASRTGDLVSKQEAARWVAANYPEWADLVENVLWWRHTARDFGDDVSPPRADVLAFVQLVATAVAPNRSENVSRRSIDGRTIKGGTPSR